MVTIVEAFGLTEERAMELLLQTNPSDFKSATEYVARVYEVVRNEDEKKFIIAQLSTCLINVTFDLSKLIDCKACGNATSKKGDTDSYIQ